MSGRPSPVLAAVVTVVYIAFVALLSGDAALVVPLALLGLVVGAAIGYRGRKRR